MEKNKLKIIIFTFALLFGSFGYITLIGFKGTPSFVTSINVELNSKKIPTTFTGLDDLKIKGIKRSSIYFQKQEKHTLKFSITFNGVSGREKVALLPHNFGKYDFINYWSFDTKEEKIISALKEYLVTNGLNQESISKIDLSTFPPRYIFKK